MRQALVPAVIVAGVFVSATAMAQVRDPVAPGAYLGASIGQSKMKDACNDVPAGISCDDKDTAWRLFGGYQLNRNFAAELGYADLGKAKASGAGVDASIEASAWDLVAVGAFPIVDRFSVFGKLGGYHGEAKSGGTFGGGKDTNNGLTYGLGAQYDFTRNVGLRGEWQRYNDMGGDNTGGKSDVDVMNVGLLYRFQ